MQLSDARPRLTREVKGTQPVWYGIWLAPVSVGHVAEWVPSPGSLPLCTSVSSATELGSSQHRAWEREEQMDKCTEHGVAYNQPPTAVRAVISINHRNQGHLVFFFFSG